MAAKLTETQIIRALERLNAGWPEGLMLQSWSGSLSLVRINEHQTDGGVYGDDIVWRSSRITNDGGDPDYLEGSAFDDDEREEAAEMAEALGVNMRRRYPTEVGFAHEDIRVEAGDIQEAPPVAAPEVPAPETER